MRGMAPCGACGTYVSAIDGCPHWRPKLMSSTRLATKQARNNEYRRKRKAKDSLTSGA